MSLSVASILGAGFLIGMKHALDADHVVAVSTIVSESKSLRKASTVGIKWGLGHTFTLFLVGLIVVVTGIRIPEKLTMSMEFIVGMVLVGLGISTIRGYYVKRVHVHNHDHDNTSHLHFHYHDKTKKHEHEHKNKASRSSFLIGMVHGMAGSGALMLLVLGTISSTTVGLLYILVFGLGSTLGMLIVSSAISLPFIFTAGLSDSLNRFMSLVAGSASVLAGLLIMFEIAANI